MELNAIMEGPAQSSRIEEHFEQARLLREESMLRHKIGLLEDFIRNRGEIFSPKKRCEDLRRRIEELEDELAHSGKIDSARVYVEDPPESEFKVVKRGEFLRWVADRDSSSTPPGDQVIVARASKKRGYGHELDNEGRLIEDGNSAPTSTAHGSKRRRLIIEKPPCLRCKILKKRCDALAACSHCPNQGYENEGDFWKVLGCFRDHLRDMSSIFCPDFSRSTQRTLRYKNGGSDIINFVLTKSRVSNQKRLRISHLVCTREDFANFVDKSWQDIAIRESVGRSATAFTGLDTHDDIFLSRTADIEDYEAAWSVFQIVSMDPTYLKKTEYNFFTLLRLGNTLSKKDHAQWDLFQQAKRLLRQSVELYLLERLCAQLASGDMIGPPPFDLTRSTPNTLVLVDLREDMEAFLGKFERQCAGRAKLAGSTQLACFFSLLTFGIAKSVLIDAYSVRSQYEEPNPCSANEAARITSAYKSLVSVFCWSSKSDVILQNEIQDEDQVARNLMQEIQLMVKSSRWKDRGYKTMKEFLLSLGTCFHPDGSYNGFFVQKFGLEEVEQLSSTTTDNLKLKQHRRVISTASDDGSDVSSIMGGSRATNSGNSPLLHIFQVDPSVNYNLSDEELSDNSSNQALSQILAKQPEFTTTFAPSLKSSEFHLSARGNSPFTFVSQDESDGQGSVRGRKGALKPEVSKKVREVRRLGACWNCWVMKMPCSSGIICNRCSKNSTSPAKGLCNRGPFAGWTDLFFPEYLTAPYADEAVSPYISENFHGHTDQEFEAELTWGDSAVMKLSVTSFIPSPTSTAQVPYKSRRGDFLSVGSLPIGVSDARDLEKLNLQRLEITLATSNNPYYASNTSMSKIAKKILEILVRYNAASVCANPLIHELLLLYLATRSLGSPLILMDPSASNIVERLQVKSDNTSLYSSRLLSLQLKNAMYRLVRKMATNALTQLEKLMRSREKSSWPVCFASILIICLIMEQVQVLAENHITAARTPDSESVLGLADEPQKSKDLLENIPFTQLTHLFHGLFRTRKPETGINPFRDEFENEFGFDDATIGMIEDIKRDILEDVDAIVDGSKASNIEKGPENLSLKGSSGYLISRFLGKFLDLDNRT